MRRFANIVALIALLLAPALASASSGILNTNSRQGKNLDQAEIHRALSTVTEGMHRVCDDAWREDAADVFVWAHNMCEFRKISSQGYDVFENSGNSRRLFETLRKANLDPPNNFQVIDRINRSTATGTSMKTIDLTSARAMDPASFQKLVRGYVEDLRAFEGPAQRWSSALGDYVRVPELQARGLEIGVQEGMLTNQQRSILRQEARRAEGLTNPVQIKVFEIR